MSMLNQKKKKIIFEMPSFDDKKEPLGFKRFEGGAPFSVHPGKDNHVCAAGFNYMTREIMYATAHGVGLYSFSTRNHLHKSLQEVFMEIGKGAEKIRLEFIFPLLLTDHWICIKNNKQFVLFNNNLEKRTDISGEPTGIYDMQINQKTHEAITIKSDRRSIKIWIVEIVDQSISHSSTQKTGTFSKNKTKTPQLEAITGEALLPPPKSKEAKKPKNAGMVRMRREVKLTHQITHFTHSPELDLFFLSLFSHSEILVFSFHSTEYLFNISAESGLKTDKNITLLEDPNTPVPHVKTSVVIPYSLGLYPKTMQEYLVLFNQDERFVLLWDLVIEQCVFKVPFDFNVRIRRAICDACDFSCGFILLDFKGNLIDLNLRKGLVLDRYALGQEKGSSIRRKMTLSQRKSHISSQTPTNRSII